jgi:hypothetical protein
LDGLINFLPHTGAVEDIAIQNEADYFVLALFCKILSMNRLIATGPSSENQTSTPVDAATSVELYLPEVEDLLRRLAKAEDLLQRANTETGECRSRRWLFGSWTVTTAAVLASICVPGCATGAMFLINVGHFDLAAAPIQQQEILGKADRLSLIEPAHWTDYRASEISAAEAHEAGLLEDAALRGAIESSPFQSSTPDAPTLVQHKLRRIASRAMPVRTPAERPEAAPPRTTSLFEKLYSVIVSPNQLSQGPSPSQT